MKIPQRDVNLARKLVKIGNQSISLGAEMLDQPIEKEAHDKLLAALENQLFDCISFIREYRRKVNPIELKGQRV